LIGGQGLGTLSEAATDCLYEGNLGNDAFDVALPPTADETLTEDTISGGDYRGVIEVSNDDRAYSAGTRRLRGFKPDSVANFNGRRLWRRSNVSKSSLRRLHREHRKQ
jgi:hypothetical protein